MGFASSVCCMFYVDFWSFVLQSFDIVLLLLENFKFKVVVHLFLPFCFVLFCFVLFLFFVDK